MQPTALALVYAGKHLSDHHRLSDYSISNGAELYLVVALRRLPPVSDDKTPQSQEEDEARLPGPESEKIGNQVLSPAWVPFGYRGIKTWAL